MGNNTLIGNVMLNKSHKEEGRVTQRAIILHIVAILLISRQLLSHLSMQGEGEGGGRAQYVLF